MGLHYQKRITLTQGITLNFSKGGPVLAIRPDATRYIVPSDVFLKLFGIPGSGTGDSLFQISALKKAAVPVISSAKSSSKKASKESEQFHITFQQGVFLPAAEKKFVKSVNLLLSGDFDGALAGFSKIPEFPDANFTAAVLYLNRGEYALADEAIDRALFAKNAIGELYLRYEIHFQLSFPVTDIYDFMMRPSPVAAYLIKAETLQNTGNNAEARDLLLQLHLEDPQNMLVLISMMELSVSSEYDNSDWLPRLIEMTASVKNDSAIHAIMQYYRGIAMKIMKRYDDAQATLTAAMKQKKERGEKLILAIMRERAEVYELQNDMKNAVAMWKKILAECPDDPVAKAKLASLQ